MTQITEEALVRRKHWVQRLKNVSGDFSSNSQNILTELRRDIESDKISVLTQHLRLCGNIPEEYKHDSSEEKLYSKYTDNLLSLTYNLMGFNSIVLTERSDAADVEILAPDYSFVADAKAFRLSRTAKNQKDFKVQAMDDWKKGKDYAMIVCPIYQLPKRNSQIYIQASTRNVCIFTYSHLALLLAYFDIEGSSRTRELLQKVFEIVPALNPSKNASDYWLPINQTIISASKAMRDLWRIEKIASEESIEAAKEEGLRYFAQEREKIMRMSHDEAIQEIVRLRRIDNNVKTISSVKNNNLFEVG